MESQYYYNKWTPGRALGHCKATLSCARDNSRALAASPWPCTGCQWLHLLKSTYIWKQLCLEKPKPQVLSTVHPITAFSRQRDPKDHQNMLKSSISTASKGKHRSSCYWKKHFTESGPSEDGNGSPRNSTGAAEACRSTVRKKQCSVAQHTEQAAGTAGWFWTQLQGQQGQLLLNTLHLLFSKRGSHKKFTLCSGHDVFKWTTHTFFRNN